MCSISPTDSCFPSASRSNCCPTTIFEAARGPVRSNDTSAASGWAPLSAAERLVLDVERFLNGAEFKGRFPDTGQDVKVFGVREDERLTATVAMPLFCADVPSQARYFARKDEILAALAARFRDAPLAVEWRLNNLDAPGRGAAGAYLTVTGTSAEDADSGQVGRGNRVGGLIAPARPTSGEAAAGKNALAHAGKIYGVLSRELAERRVFPAIDLVASSTRREELLLDEASLAASRVLRQRIAGMTPINAMNDLLVDLRRNPTSAELVRALNGG